MTDKPSPITVGLAQKAPLAVSLLQLEKSDADNLSTLFDHNVTRGALKNLVTDKPSPITVGLAQLQNPVENPPMNNWSVNQPSPPHAKGMGGKDTLGFNMVVEGHKIALSQILPINQEMNKPGNFLIKERNPDHEPANL